MAYPMFVKESTDHTEVKKGNEPVNQDENIGYRYQSTILGMVIDPKRAWMAFFLSFTLFISFSAYVWVSHMSQPILGDSFSVK